MLLGQKNPFRGWQIDKNSNVPPGKHDRKVFGADGNIIPGPISNSHLRERLAHRLNFIHLIATTEAKVIKLIQFNYVE